MDKNDMRVAEVWMDEYKSLFYNARGLHGQDFGDVTRRLALRKDLKCHSFKWFLDTIHPDKFVPDLQPLYHGILADPDKRLCVDNMQHDSSGSPVGLYGCHGGSPQRWALARDGGIFHDSMCLKAVERVVMMPCGEAHRWKFEGKSLRPMISTQTCLHRDGNRVNVAPCSTKTPAQEWKLTPQESGESIGSIDDSQCIDNDQKSAGPVILYGCHGKGGQAWKRTEAGKIAMISNPNVCLAIDFAVLQYECTKWMKWVYDESKQTLQYSLFENFCLDRESMSSGGQPKLRECADDTHSQRWQFFKSV